MKSNKIKHLLYSSILIILLPLSLLQGHSYSKDFLWGTAIAEHQNSGTPDSNWALFEQNKNWLGNTPIKDNQTCGKAVDHWNRYKEDIALMKQLGLNSFRFSIDWSRIEPKKGKISKEALQHYDDLCDALIAADIAPMATLHHFTHPAWFQKKGAFEREENSKYFISFSKLVFERFHKKISLWCTFNEPAIHAMTGHLLGLHAPGKKDLVTAVNVLKNMLYAHVDIYKTLKSMPGGSQTQIGIVHNILKFRPRYGWEPLEKGICSFFTKLHNDLVMDFFKSGNFNYHGAFETFLGINGIEIYSNNTDAPQSFDFFGLNYYARAVVGFNAQDIFGATCFPDQIMGDMYLPLDPEGFNEAIHEAAQFGKPLYITENGTADKKNRRRMIALRDYIKVIDNAGEEGLDIRGYYHWTLVDNFEWNEGWQPKFGLFTKDRIIKPSGKYYRNLIEQRS